MKKFITLLVTLGVGLAVLTPATSEARDGPEYYTTCGYCGGAIYRQHIVIDRTRHGKAVKYWQVLPHHCRGGGYGGGYRGGYGRPPYGGGYHHHHPGYGGRVSIPFPGFFFGR